MLIAMSSALMLARVEGLQFLQDFSSRDFVWLLIGAMMAVLVCWGVSRRRRRWF
ncbi:MAG: hypothetical protein ABSG51_14640 [Terracidiphilus sp.]|jgi:hypothetical protein